MPDHERLDAKDEERFQKWIRATPWFAEFKKNYGEEPDLNTSQYNYRKAWKSGVEPQKDPHDGNRYHWPSIDPKSGEMLKSPDHPTAWKEEYMQATGQNPDDHGLTKDAAMQELRIMRMYPSMVGGQMRQPQQPQPPGIASEILRRGKPGTP